MQGPVELQERLDILADAILCFVPSCISEQPQPAVDYPSVGLPAIDTDKLHSDLLAHFWRMNRAWSGSGVPCFLGIFQTCLQCLLTTVKMHLTGQAVAMSMERLQQLKIYLDMLGEIESIVHTMQEQ